MRIAWLLPIAWFYWQPMLSEFSKLFPNTKVFTGKWSGFARGYENTIDVKQVGRIQFYEVAKGVGYNPGFTYLSPSIIIELFKFRPQVIFADSFRIWTIIALFLKPFFGWKVILTYEGSSPGVDYANSTLRLLLRKIMVRAADALVTNSKGGAKYLIGTLKARQETVFVQPYEVPSVKSLPQSSDIADKWLQLKQPVFLFVGHIVPRKGLKFLLEACAILHQQQQEFTLMVVGDGTEQDELKTFCRERSLQNCVKWLGRVEYQDIGNYFNQADVFIFPTLEDTWGVTVLEAMLLGKPILCSTGAGTAELIIDGENGYVFEPGKVDLLARLMSIFINDPRLIEEMGAKSQAVMNRYTPENASQTLAKAVESTLALDY